jgi:hypothetical protein
MNSSQIQAALADVTGETDPAVKMLKLASLLSSVCEAQGIQFVVVGGSAIELLTEGAYVSGDLDLCLQSPGTLPLRRRQELMGELGAKGGPRSWQVAGMFVDLLGPLESLARTPLRKLQGPYGLVQVVQPEELLVERVLVSVYPHADLASRDCARKLAAVALAGATELDWQEVQRLASRPEYRILPECKVLVREVANELKTKSPLDTDE